MLSHNLINCNVSVDAIGELRTKTQETGFLPEYFVRATETRKNPVSDHPRASHPLMIRRLKPLLYIIQSSIALCIISTR
ncbi:hypothetical protein IQ270_20135 [Microcoleus sp. LEGE 07076]|uniref:hypothetical protein n=1 Tax=Microcoleus sp. LEGE 07076 TaxID=915322 RepID=UPI00187FB640|nr:hypothetical protein [Microcoleus sp. LEGE 07076]MBE9186902.1 hypothetical protein [Microcoleus sp. LEGE 07076]